MRWNGQKKPLNVQIKIHFTHEGKKNSENWGSEIALENPTNAGNGCQKSQRHHRNGAGIPNANAHLAGEEGGGGPDEEGLAVVFLDHAGGGR